MTLYSVIVLWDSNVGLTIIDIMHPSFSVMSFNVATFIENDENVMINRVYASINAFNIENLQFTRTDPSNGELSELSFLQNDAEGTSLYMMKVFPNVT